MNVESIPDSSTTPSSSTATDSPTARVKRILDATPEEVFDAWTDPEQARQWMCPGGSTVSDLTLEARVGGRLRLLMHVDGKDFVHLGEFLDVERPRRLIFTLGRNRQGVPPVQYELGEPVARHPGLRRGQIHRAPAVRAELLKSVALRQLIYRPVGTRARVGRPASRVLLENGHDLHPGWHGVSGRLEPVGSKA